MKKFLKVLLVLLMVLTEKPLAINGSEYLVNNDNYSLTADGILTINNFVNIDDLMDYYEVIEKVVINEEITELAKGAFNNFTNLKEVSLSYYLYDKLANDPLAFNGKQVSVSLFCNLHPEVLKKNENEVKADCLKAGSYDEVSYCKYCLKQLGRESKTTAKTEHSLSYQKLDDKTGYYLCNVCNQKFNDNKEIVTDLYHAYLSETSFNIGESKQISFSAIGNQNISYTSSNSKVASVNANGLVTGEGVGSCDITIKYGDQPATVIKVSVGYNIKVERASNTALKISWPKVSGATGYYIYRSTKSGSGYKKIASISKGSTTSYTNKKLKNGTTYYYYVVAVKKGKTLAKSTKLAGVALKTTSVKVSINNEAYLQKITYSKVSGATGYEVYFSTNGKDYSLVYDGTALSYSAANLKTGVTYSYKVRAYKKVSGKKIYGPYGTVSGKQGLPAPVVTAVKEVSSTQTLITYNKVEGATGYQIYRSTTYGSGYKQVKETNELSYTDNNGTTSYYYQVYAIYKDSNGNITKSKPSEAVSGYCGKITNKANVNSGIRQLVIDFYNDYYRSIKNLSAKDMSKYFSSKEQAYMFNTALKYLVNTRKLSVNDLTLTDCSYDLNFKAVSVSKGVYKVVVWEDSHLNFEALNGLQSNTADIENTFWVKKVNGKYKITKLYKEESFFLTFYKNYKSTKSYAKALDKIYNQYFGYVKKGVNTYENYRSLVNNGQGKVYASAANSYDRNKAVAYAQTYWHTRNKGSYFSLSSNCMNFGSQVLRAGGIPMDYSGSAANNQQWKYYSGSYNTKEVKSGYVYAWTSMQYFRKYVKQNTSAGLKAAIDENIYLAEGGDLIHVGYKEGSLSHNLVVVDTLKNSKGEIVDLIVNGNTIDMQNFPLSASAYPYKILIKVLGYN